MSNKKELDIDQMIKMYEDGNGTPYIALVFGVSQATVYNRLKNVGVKMRPKGGKSVIKNKLLGNRKPNFKYKTVDSDGYVLVWSPNHPNRNKDN